VCVCVCAVHPAEVREAYQGRERLSRLPHTGRGVEYYAAGLALELEEDDEYDYKVARFGRKTSRKYCVEVKYYKEVRALLGSTQGASTSGPGELGGA
jgi:hypothetical protein